MLTLLFLLALALLFAYNFKIARQVARVQREIESGRCETESIRLQLVKLRSARSTSNSG